MNTKPKRQAEQAERVEVEAVARFRHDGQPVLPGARILMSAAEAAELNALGFVTTLPYRDRAMRARSR